ncbi:GyrI-like domain-containing protein [Nocardia sp. NPDC049190]|uniref:GyrI-like domain-containing protein n=1 Tax=Nocardia sp. NPDC049190 TaxID=3155650 RepID=UPI0034053F40
MTTAPVPKLTSIDPAATAAIRDVVPLVGLRDFFDASFGALVEMITAQRLEISSPAFGLYRGSAGDLIDIEVGFAVNRAVEPTGDVIAGSLPGGQVARLIHVGGFEGLGSAWDQLHSWIESQGLTAGEKRWEVYITEPSPEMDPRELRTELHWPIVVD